MRYLILALLAGCAQLVPIDYSIKPPYDWPKLRELVLYMDGNAVRAMCKIPATNRATNCAMVNFREGTCTIYLSRESAEALEHERAHCAGYDHVGDAGRSRESWERWKEHKRNGGV